MLPGGRDGRGQDPKYEIMLSSTRRSDYGEETAEDFIGKGVSFDYLSGGEEEERICSSLGCC